MEACPATEQELSPEEGVFRELDDQSGENEILFDILRADPRHEGTPVRDVGLCDHRSCSMAVLACTLHRLSRRRVAGLLGESGV